MSALADEWIEHVRTWLGWGFDLVDTPVLVYFFVINTSYLILIALATLTFRGHARSLPFAGRDKALSPDLSPGVSILVPAYNEEAGIVAAVQAMLSLRYGDHEVIVANDGSTDPTLRRLIDAFDLVDLPSVITYDVPTTVEPTATWVPRDGRTPLVVIDKPNSGRSDALNVALNMASKPLVAMVDADSILDPDALLVVCKPFVDDPLRTVATGGVIRAANGSRVVAGRLVDVRMPRRLLPRIQVIEYLRAFLLGRAGWSRVDALILISGAFGLFRRDVVVQAGGLDPGSIGEDFELVMRIHKMLRDAGRDYHVVFVGEPVSWTEVPATVKVLASQRRRWHRGLWEVLWKYRGMLGRPRYGRISMVALPYYWMFELIAPLLELFGVIAVPVGLVLGIVAWKFALTFVLIAYAYGTFVSLAAVVVDEIYFNRYRRWSDLRLALTAVVWENLGYRQLTALWRLQGWWAALRGRRQVWGTMTREGFSA